MTGEDEFHDDNPPPPPPVTPTQQAPHTLSTIKLPILKKCEYDIWAMKREHYLGHTDYPIWEIMQKGNGPVQVLTDTNGQIKVLPPKTAEEILVRERERKARTTLLMAIQKTFEPKFLKNDWMIKKYFSIFQLRRIAQKVMDRFQSLESTSRFMVHVSPLKIANKSFLELEEALIFHEIKEVLQEDKEKALQFEWPREEPVGFDKTKVVTSINNNTGNFAYREYRSKGIMKAEVEMHGNTGYRAKVQWEET
ncbi:hypothetical protein Tco_0539523 [Tanacetum coccineum]